MAGTNLVPETIVSAVLFSDSLNEDWGQSDGAALAGCWRDSVRSSDSLYGLGDEPMIDKFLDVSGLKRSPVCKKRRKARRGPMREPKYRHWLKTEWCVIIRRRDVSMVDACNNVGCLPYLSDPAHTENNGTSSKGPDSSCVPLCRKHHREYDAGREAFEKKYGVHMPKIAAEHYARYKAERAGGSL